MKNKNWLIDDAAVIVKCILKVEQEKIQSTTIQNIIMEIFFA